MKHNVCVQYFKEIINLLIEGLEVFLPVTIIQDFYHLKPACPAIFFPIEMLEFSHL